MTEVSINTGLYFVKYLIAYSVLFVIVPCFIFTNIKTDIVKSMVSNYIKMTFWVVALGYIAIVIKLFEFITFFVIIAISISYKYYKRHIEEGDLRSDIGDDVQLLVINHVDNIERIENKFLKYVAKGFNRIASDISSYFGNIWSVLGFALLCVAFGYAGYLCFYDAFVNMAPAAGESYNTLVNMKYLGSRVLFYDHIYPQGFYIVLETLQKVAMIDHLFMVNFSGALDTLLIAFGMYYFVSRISKNQASGILAVVLYGILGVAFVHSPSLQTVAGPQQFAMVFVLPVLHFFYEYIQASKREDFFAAFFGSAVIGLVHPLAFVFLAIGLLTLCLANLMRDARKTFYKTFVAVVFMLIATVISVVPIGIGLLLGKDFGSSMVHLILASDPTIVMAMPGRIDYIGAVSLGIVLLHALLSIPRKSDFIKTMWIFLFGAVALAGYLFAGVFTQSPYIKESAETLWNLLVPVIIAFGFKAVLDLLKRLMRVEYVGHILCSLFLVGVLIYLPQQPRISKKQEYNSMVMQYLQITKNFRPTQWMMVSWQEGYALSMGNGFHMMIDEFIDRYDPQGVQLIDRYDPDAEPLETEDILIFYEKQVYGTQERIDEASRYREEIRHGVVDWLNAYNESHTNLKMIYNDDYLQVWRIHQEPDREKELERLWQY